MSGKQKHRGQHGNDPRLFHDRWLPVLNQAVADLSWMLSRGYADNSALKLVGDRYRLNLRQRKAVGRASCSDQSRHLRAERLLPVEALRGREVLIDGYNLLITIESALAGGIVLLSRDGCFRDIASVHGTYRRVEETMPALTMIGVNLQKLGVGPVSWLLDRPVSNSGRLMGFMYELSEQYGFDWQIELVNNPDRALIAQPERISITSDSWVLDRITAWYNLHRDILATIPSASIIDLGGAAD
ncbi:MAG: DUF434 domain-containing protein [Bacteroidetes bacterium]|nr:MAG: DUF434 domain-containing protein [Bacteroidota bacterium]